MTRVGEDEWQVDESVIAFMNNSDVRMRHCAIWVQRRHAAYARLGNHDREMPKVHADERSGEIRQLTKQSLDSPNHQSDLRQEQPGRLYCTVRGLSRLCGH